MKRSQPNKLEGEQRCMGPIPKQRGKPPLVEGLWVTRALKEGQCCEGHRLFGVAPGGCANHHHKFLGGNCQFYFKKWKSKNSRDIKDLTPNHTVI